MNYKEYKKFKISEIGIGTYSLSGVYGKKDLNEFKKMINRAYELGINFFDTAEAYGDAEKILGEFVKDFRKNIYIATKVGIKKGVIPNLKEDYILTACEESLKNLKTDYIDLYQIHFNDPYTPVEETVNALEKLKKEGKIREYGIGHLPMSIVEEYFKIGNVFSFLVELSAVVRESKRDLIPLSEKYNIGIIAFSTTGRGILTGKFNENKKFEPQDIRNFDPLFQYEKFESAIRIYNKFKELSKKYDKTPVQMAINWVLCQNKIITALIGPSNIEHLEEDIKASGFKISNDDLNELEIFFKKEDEWIKEEAKKRIYKILNEPLNLDFFKNFKDLVYVIEMSLILKLTEEKEILPIFQKLFGFLKNFEKISKNDFENIKEELKNLINY
ncbi:MAG: aldo/keto reductase [Caldisericia bacterium]|nr:aldo/keto reductase [Caldisericia bacterium]